MDRYRASGQISVEDAEYAYGLVPEDFDEVAALTAQGWEVIEDSLSMLLVPAAWDPAHRTWVRDPLPYFALATDGRGQVVGGTDEGVRKSRHADLREAAHNADLPDPPVERLWLLRSPFPGTTADEIIAAAARRVGDGSTYLGPEMYRAIAIVMGRQQADDDSEPGRPVPGRPPSRPSPAPEAPAGNVSGDQAVHTDPDVAAAVARLEHPSRQDPAQPTTAGRARDGILAATTAIAAIRRHAGREDLSDPDVATLVLAELLTIADAVSALPAALTDTEPGTPWQAIAGLRRSSERRYLDIDRDELAAMVDNTLLPLNDALARLHRLLGTSGS